MARKLIALFVCLIVFPISALSVHGQRLMTKEQNHNNNNNNAETKTSATAFYKLYLEALAKRTLQSSGPGKKGHFGYEKLVARHLGIADQILRSVPSPGVGN